MNRLSVAAGAMIFASLAADARLHGQTPPSPADDPPFRLPSSVQVISDLVYDEVDGRVLKLDLFMSRVPTGDCPGLVFINNGGFIYSVRKWTWRQAARMAELGFVSVTIETRLAPASHYPAPLNDAQAAVRWLRSHGSQYRVDTSKIGVVGVSSGGYVAAALGTNLWSGRDWSGAPPNVRVQAVVAFNPNVDFPPLAVIPTGDNVETFLGRSFARDSSAWRDASVVSHVSRQAAPFLLLHGTADQVVPYSQSADMVQRLQRVSVRADLFTADGAAHGFASRPPWYAPTLARMEKFLLEVLK